MYSLIIYKKVRYLWLKHICKSALLKCQLNLFLKAKRKIIHKNASVNCRSSTSIQVEIGTQANKGNEVLSIVSCKGRCDKFPASSSARDDA